MKLAHRISDHGIKVTFVNSDFIHAKLLAALPHEAEARSGIELASIPDGLDPGDDRKDLPKLTESISRVMPSHLKDLIEKANRSNDVEQIICVVADISLGWRAMEVAEKMGILGVPLFPAGPEILALALHIPKLIEARIIRSTDGSPLNDELICLSKDIPVFSSSTLPWWLLSNSVYELDSSACWLEKQPAGSVIYVAFGSLAIFNQRQFNELALGLELVGRPFLWVVQSDFTDGSAAEYPDGFIERVADHGKLVSWAPQEEVLAHPSVSCFFSHCGWNSTMDSISMGNPDENGFVSRHEIKMKIEKLVSDDGIKANAEKLKEMARKSASEGGSSYKNFKTFIEPMKQ
ncbi:UDP-glycosyltransferase 83A1 [Vitis vinifera]|uniref:UDP-glycosyltransferase 83A1 n=1 Tax=Vitis vinifera TaxID=29760 RepID=A0A438HM93_VITVI|nr:UDP-glycosyltransferase 83A1 [Vitis vinifera]